MGALRKRTRELWRRHHTSESRKSVDSPLTSVTILTEDKDSPNTVRAEVKNGGEISLRRKTEGGLLCFTA